MKIFAANWKLHKTPEETREFFSAFLKIAKTEVTNEIVFFPPATSLDACSQVLGERPNINWGAQNVFYEGKGAWTGETSADVVKSLGGQWVLVGHSERRSFFSETNPMIYKKMQFIASLSLKPMLCIGETLQEREAGLTESVLQNQMLAALSGWDCSKKLAIAYEPVWAIGTGKVATVDQVRDTHNFIYKQLEQMELPLSTPLLYGGSVKPENSLELSQIEHVDGFLVGGASLDVLSFAKICQLQ